MGDPGDLERPTGVSESLNADLCWLLSRASYTLTTRLMAALEEIAISPRAWSVLAAAVEGEHTQGDIARMVGLDKTTMVVTVDELEDAGLAERRPARGDRRARVITVTPAGRRTLMRATKIAARVREEVLGVLEPDDRELFLASLARLVGDPLAEPVRCSPPVRRRAPRPIARRSA